MTQVSIKNINKNTFREFKAEAIREGLTVGQALTSAMELWLTKTDTKLSFMNFKPSDWGKGTERLSEQIDEILYG
ncbi:MAG TPA: hypothetical protein VJB66_01950 [Candidatus Nanoarchaeia archaeon]|nr:hypothetical protein [Candidatus Nanoarchaeia archaeon]